MDKREEFKQLLYSTRISNKNYNEGHDKCAKLQKWLLDNIPSQLYRFRTFNKENEDKVLYALQNDEVWGSRLITFNDYFEGIPYFNQDEVEKYNLKLFSEDIFCQLARDFKIDIVPDFIKVLGDSIDLNKLKDLVLTIANKDDWDKEIIQYKEKVDIYHEMHKDEIFKFFNETILDVERFKYIACFTEELDNSLMWGHYADGHRGFCLCYDFREFIKPYQVVKKDAHIFSNFLLDNPIVPVIYNDERYDATNYYKDIKLESTLHCLNLLNHSYNSDVLIGIKTLLTKSKDWAYEKEWRLYTPNLYETDHVDNHGIICNLRPKELYVGWNMKLELSDKLYEICRDKKILCYKIVPIYNDGTYKMSFLDYETFRKEKVKFDN